MNLKEMLEHSAACREETVKDALVCLFSDGTYGTYFSICVPLDDDGTNKKLIDYWRDHGKELGDCREDKWSYVIQNGGTLRIYDNEDTDDEGNGKSYDVDAAKFDAGADLFSKNGHHYGNFIQGNDDAYTGCAFLQYVAFGELIY